MKWLLIVASLLLPSCQSDPEPTIPSAPVPALPALTLSIPWTGGTYDVPPPAMIPDSFKNSPAYRRWERIKDIEEFRIPLEAGQVLVAQTMGFALQDGKLHPMIFTMHVYRADGTLELEQMNGPGTDPEEWTVYADDGKTKLVHVANRISGIANVPFIEYVDFYRDGKPDHQFAIHTPGQVTYDWELRDEHSTGKLLHPTRRDRDKMARKAIE